MKILFTDLEQSEISCPVVEDGWFPADDLKLVDSPQGRITACLTGSSEAIVKGRFDFTVDTSCDRCCSMVRLGLAAEFAYVCIVGGEEYEKVRQETECREEDYNRIYLQEPVIDLGEMCCEQVYLSMPSQILCDESCQGLCQVCGTDLNKGSCDCEKNHGESPFAVLSRLKDRRSGSE